MKRFYLPLLFLLCLLSGETAFTQNCKVSIAEERCLGSTLQAITDSTKRLDTLTWFRNNLPVQVTTSRSYRSFGDTITSFDIFAVSLPSDVALDDSGNIYVAENCKISKWTKKTNAWTQVAGNNSCTNNGAVQFANSVAIDSLGYVYAGEDAGRVSKWYNGKRVALVSGLGEVARIRFDKNGALYILDKTNNAVYKLPYGATRYTLVAGGNGAGSALNQFNTPTCVAIDDDLNVYVGDPANNRVTKWAPGAKTGVLVAGGGTGSGTIYDVYPKDIEVDAAHNLYILNGSTTITYWPAGTSYGIKAGNIYFYAYETYEGQHMIRDKKGNIYEGLNGYVYRFPVVNVFDKSLATEPFRVSANFKVRSRYGNGCVAVSDSLTLVDHPYDPLIQGQDGGTCGLTLPYFNYYGHDDPTHPTSVWTVPPKTTLVSGQNTDTIHLKSGADFKAGVITVTISNACSTASASDYIVAAPLASNIGGYKNVDAGQKRVRYTIYPREENSVYTWSVPPGASIVQGQGTDTVYVNFGTTSGKITAVTTNPCGSVNNNSLRVTVSSAFGDKEANGIITGMQPKGVGISSLKLYPQPAVTEATLSVTSGTSEAASLLVKDVLGKTLSNTSIRVVTGTNVYHLPVASLPGGTYFVSLVSRQAPVQTVKMLVVK